MIIRTIEEAVLVASIERDILGTDPDPLSAEQLNFLAALSTDDLVLMIDGAGSPAANQIGLFILMQAVADLS